MVWLIGVLAAAAEPGRPPQCRLASENLRFIQQGLADWQRVRRDGLRLAASPLPWLVLYDAQCVWHLGAPASPQGAERQTAVLRFDGAPVALWGQARDAAARLPDGSALPSRALAITSLYQNDQAAFVVLALPELWRSDPLYAADPQLEANLAGVMIHELVHTQHLRAAARRIRQLANRYTLPVEIHDDLIEQRFRHQAGFAAAYQAEIDLVYQALAEPSADLRRALVRKALVLASERRRRYFHGPATVYRELEDIFLNLEGVAVWTGFKVAQAQNRIAPDADPRHFSWAQRSWSRDYGLALLLLIEQLLPGWQARVLGSELAAPLMLLSEALAKHSTNQVPTYYAD